MVKALLLHDKPKTEKEGCPYCEGTEIRWAEKMRGTYWKQCADCGMIYVGHDADQREIDNEVSV